MKQLFVLLSFFAALGVATAQAPQGINFQGVARDAQWHPIGSQSVSLAFKITDGFGAQLYAETQIQTTNAVGLFNAVVGKGSPSGNSFSSIPWGSGGQKFLEVFVNGTSIGRQEMVSVPYALYAEKSGSGGQTYSAGSGININGSNVISNTGDADANPSNELQTLTFDPNTKIVSLSQNGGSFQLPTVGGGTYTAGSGININGSNVISNTGDNDNDPANEIQTLQVIGTDKLKISSGNTVTLPTPPGDDWGNGTASVSAPLTGNGTSSSPIKLQNGTAMGQTLVWDGTKWAAGAAPAAAPEIYVFEEQYAHGLVPTTASGQQPVGGAFNTRNLNTQVYPTVGGAGNVTLGGSLLTFKPGTYLIDASAPAFFTGRHQLFLRRSDNNVILLSGTCETNAINNGNVSNGTGIDQNRSFMKGVLVVPNGIERVVELDHYLDGVFLPGTTPLGIEFAQTATFWNTIKEVYATITIQKIQ